MHPMSYRWIPIIATFVVMLIGHILSRVTLADYEKRAKKTAEFRDKFIDLANRYMEYHQVDPKLYQECIREVDDIQAELGYDGIVAEFIDPLKNIKMTNMQVLVNVFPVFVKRKCEQKGPKKVSTFSTRFHVVSNVFPKYQMLTF